MQENSKKPTFIRRLQTCTRNVTGSNAYWHSKTNELKAGIEQLGSGTVFMSYSMADLHWPELHELLGVRGATRRDILAAVNNNPHIVVSYFVKRMRDWNKTFLQRIFEEDWSWLRYENQGKGTVHAHLIAKLLHEPKLLKLIAVIFQGRKAQKELAKISKSNNFAEDEQELLKQQAAGLLAERRVRIYCDMLISTWNPLDGKQVMINIHVANRWMTWIMLI